MPSTCVRASVTKQLSANTKQELSGATKVSEQHQQRVEELEGLVAERDVS